MRTAHHHPRVGVLLKQEKGRGLRDFADSSAEEILKKGLTV